MMSKYDFVFLVIIVVCFSCGTTHQQKEHEPEEIINSKEFMLVDVPYSHDNISGGTLKGNQLISLKEYFISAHNIDLNAIHYLTIGYLKSANDCWYDNYKVLNANARKKYIENKIIKSNTTLLFLHYDKGHGGGINKYDVEHFFHDLFQKHMEKRFVIIL